MKYSIVFGSAVAISLGALVVARPATPADPVVQIVNATLPAKPSPPAGPSKGKREDITDIDVLNFALTLEHLENVFYDGSLKMFTQEDFNKAGYPNWVRNRFEQVKTHEATHVKFLETAIKAAGAQAVQPCTYNFGVTNPQEFAKTSAILETVGTSAYTGAAHLIQNKDYLTAAASILATESRQSAWANSAVRKQNPWSGAFETPLSANHVFSLAAPLIVSCPESNPKLPFKPFPALSLPASSEPGQKVTLNFDAPMDGQLYAVFLNDNRATFVPMKGKDVVIPKKLKGTVFVLVSNTHDSAADEHTIAGPGIVLFDEDSEGKVVMA